MQLGRQLWQHGPGRGGANALAIWKTIGYFCECSFIVMLTRLQPYARSKSLFQRMLKEEQTPNGNPICSKNAVYDFNRYLSTLLHDNQLDSRTERSAADIALL